MKHNQISSTKTKKKENATLNIQEARSKIETDPLITIVQKFRKITYARQRKTKRKKNKNKIMCLLYNKYKNKKETHQRFNLHKPIKGMNQTKRK